jgi:hydrogenase expression/formation protein HypE
MNPSVIESLEAPSAPSLLSTSCPVPISTHKEIVIAHGSGGKLTRSLIEKLVLPAFANGALNELHDGAALSIFGGQLAFTSDSFVVNPIFFPGGDIGDLAINGTVNDLAMCGSRPLYLSAAFIIEEGFAMERFSRVLESMRRAAMQAGVSIVTGDTKVVERGKGDGIFISTSGIGIIPSGVTIHPRRAQVGDKIILNGTIADHGIAIMAARESLAFETAVNSDTAPLNGLVEAMLAVEPDIHVMRDPTRGGVSSALCEIASQAGLSIRLNEASIPIREEVRAACELLGFDPLYVANEGKLLAFVPPSRAGAVLEAMRAHPFGQNSAIIGEVTAEPPGVVIMKTRVGGNRVVEMLAGEQLPRIC